MSSEAGTTTSVSDLTARCATETGTPGGVDHPVVRSWQGWQRFLAALDRSLDAALREYGATRNQLTVLAAIAHAEGITQQRLSAQLGLTKASTSQMLTRLETNGLVVRIPEARAYALRLTDNGRALIERTIAAHYELIVERFGVLDPDEQRALARLTDKLVDSISNWDEVERSHPGSTGNQFC